MKNSMNVPNGAGTDRKKFVTVSEAARHLRVARNTIYEACRDNELACLRIRSSLRVLIDVKETYLTVAEAAEVLNISPSTIYEACTGSVTSGGIPHVRIRSRIRIPLGKLKSSCMPGGSAHAMVDDEPCGSRMAI